MLLPLHRVALYMKVLGSFIFIYDYEESLVLIIFYMQYYHYYETSFTMFMLSLLDV